MPDGYNPASPGVVGAYGGGHTASYAFEPQAYEPSWRWPTSGADVSDVVGAPTAYSIPTDPERFPGQGMQSFVTTD